MGFGASTAGGLAPIKSFASSFFGLPIFDGVAKYAADFAANSVSSESRETTVDAFKHGQYFGRVDRCDGMLAEPWGHVIF